MNTKRVNIITISEEQFKRELNNAIPMLVSAELNKLDKDFTQIKAFCRAITAENNWIPIKNKKLYFNHIVAGLFPDFKSIPIQHCMMNQSFDQKSFRQEFEGYTGSLITLEEFRRAFAANTAEVVELFRLEGTYFTVEDSLYSYTFEEEEKKWGVFAKEESYHIPICRLSRKRQRDLTPLQSLYLLMRENLIPKELPEELLDSYDALVCLLKKGKEYFIFETDTMDLNRKLIMEAIMEGRLNELNHEEINAEKLKETMENQSPISSISPQGYHEYIEKLLNCDTIRCDIERYDEKILSDPNRGHWDIWEEPDDNAKYTIRLENGLIARNPLVDINYEGVISIDFGTKSTVVVYQENTEHTLPMRIGTGRISDRVEENHYENPTVMELIDLDQFLERYYEKEGRPETEWKDLTISHTANNSMLDSNSTEYYTFFHELKQWAADKRRQIRLKDKKNKDILLPPFLEIKEGEFNPIEIYAYYIGLYINNMHNGIYLDYILSFPVTYENAIGQKIIESFERGIKKSLPKIVLEDEEAMKRFRVTSSISEPAAYAICALEECFGDLEENEQIYYGIFDFGGGTTDFDYGVWREAPEAEQRKYDYVLECFGSGGDQYLGGENLLELLAFEVFKNNQEILREEKISFVLPPECNRFPGSEVLISGSQEAKLNMRQLMECLRPFWEEKEGYEEMFEGNVICVTLFDKEGRERKDIELEVSAEFLEDILKKRIGKGVVNFFEGLKAAFEVTEQKKIAKVDIFLAGNSSRSRIVSELFNEYITFYTDPENKDADGAVAEQFVMHLPLGFNKMIKSEESEEQTEDELQQIMKPTGKTGVAFGLIEGRPGGRIKVLLPDLPKYSNGLDNEIKFKYYIGYKKKNCFRIISDRNIPYGVWTELYDASIPDFTIYYTSLPEALTNQLSILEVSKKNCRLSRAYRDANIYYRTVDPTTIEYVVANEEDLEKGEFLEEIIRIDLS